MLDRFADRVLGVMGSKASLGVVYALTFLATLGWITWEWDHGFWLALISVSLLTVGIFALFCLFVWLPLARLISGLLAVAFFLRWLSWVVFGWPRPDSPA